MTSCDGAVDPGNGAVGDLARIVAAAELRHELVPVVEMGFMHKGRELEQILNTIFVT